MGDLTPETMGCQLWGIMGDFLVYRPLTDPERDALKRRLFGYLDLMKDIGYDISAIQVIKTDDMLRTVVNEMPSEMLAEVFWKSKWVD